VREQDTGEFTFFKKVAPVNSVFGRRVVARSRIPHAHTYVSIAVYFALRPEERISRSAPKKEIRRHVWFHPRFAFSSTTSVREGTHVSRHLSFFAASVASFALFVVPAVQGEAYTQAASSFNHTCAIYGSGGLHCWGANTYGQLGDGTTTNSAIPVVVPSLTGVTSVSAGRVHTCALAQGVVRCWGDGSDGQLGNGTTNSSPIPVPVVGLTTVTNQAVALAVGADFSCAQMQNVLSGLSTVRCWGGNSVGQVGNGTTSPQVFVPATVSGLTGVTHLTAGSYFACAVTGGTVRCWGSGISGQFGIGTTVLSSDVPAAAATGITNATIVTAGGSHVCAANSNTGDAWCWGDRSFGQVGDGVISSTVRTSPYYFGASFRPTKIYAANAGNCAVVSGQAFCWGLNNQGQLGNAGQPTGNSGSPLPVTGQNSGVATMAAGLNHACAISAAGAMSCWGDNALGQRGSAPFGAGTPVYTPIGVVKCSLDLDGDGVVLATTDAVLMARAALGYSGPALTTNALAASAPRRTSTDLRDYLSTSCGFALIALPMQ
jgi:alpha-tubulin suppressor-like RCC1 family protein